MGFEDMPGFQAALEQTRKKVQTLFEQCLPQTDKPDDEANPWNAYWQRLRHSAQNQTREEAHWKPLSDFVKRLSRLSLSQRASRRLDQFMPLLLERFDDQSPDDAIVNRVLDLVSSICRRSAYL